MADKTYNLTLTLSNGNEIDAGNFVVPQGEKGADGTNGKDALFAITNVTAAPVVNNETTSRVGAFNRTPIVGEEGILIATFGEITYFTTIEIVEIRKTTITQVKYKYTLVSVVTGSSGGDGGVMTPQPELDWNNIIELTGSLDTVQDGGVYDCTAAGGTIININDTNIYKKHVFFEFNLGQDERMAVIFELKGKIALAPLVGIDYHSTEIDGMGVFPEDPDGSFLIFYIYDTSIEIKDGVIYVNSHKIWREK